MIVANSMLIVSTFFVLISMLKMSTSTIGSVCFSMASSAERVLLMLSQSRMGTRFRCFWSRMFTNLLCSFFIEANASIKLYFSLLLSVNFPLGSASSTLSRLKAFFLGKLSMYFRSSAVIASDMGEAGASPQLVFHKVRDRGPVETPMRVLLSWESLRSLTPFHLIGIEFMYLHLCSARQIFKESLLAEKRYFPSVSKVIASIARASFLVSESKLKSSKSKYFTFLSNPALASLSSRGLYMRQVTGPEGSSKLCTRRFSLMSQMFTRLSLLPDEIQQPSGENLTTFTWEVWSLKDSMGFLDLRSQTLTVVSQEPEAMMFWSVGSPVRQLISERWAVKERAAGVKKGYSFLSECRICG